MGPWREEASPSPPGDESSEEGEMERRIVGLDLGVATDHTAVIMDGEGRERGRRRVRPTRTSLEALLAVALAGAAGGTVVEGGMQPTGPARRPGAGFFGARWHPGPPG